MVDGDFLDRRSDIKNMKEISEAVDSLVLHADSAGRSMYKDIKRTTYPTVVLSASDSIKAKKAHLSVVNTDSIYQSMTSSEKLKLLTAAVTRANSLHTDWGIRSFITRSTDENIRNHLSDWHKKITLSLALHH